MKPLVIYCVFVLSCTVRVEATQENSGQTFETCCDTSTTSVDLTTGTISVDSGDIWASPVSSFTKGTHCGSRGVLKVVFGKPQTNETQCNASCHRRLLKVDMTLHRQVRDGLLFHFVKYQTIDGSVESPYKRNSIYGKELIEVEGKGNNIAVYKHDVKGSWSDTQFQNAINSDVGALNVKLATNYYEIMNFDALDVKGCDRLSSFDPSAVQDREHVYLAFNRAIDTASTSGRGVCHVKLSWDCPLSKPVVHSTSNDVSGVEINLFLCMVCFLAHMSTKC